jgi:predicted nucleotidyltransferase
MINTFSSEVQQQIKESLKLLRTVLGSDLLGVYLYGSSFVGGLQRYSDIDFFVITSRATTLEERRHLVTNLLQISGIYMKSIKLPIEMTLVEKTAINPWHYPPQFDFQYGEWLRTSFEQGDIEPWETHEMPDLAVIITQILLKSHTLFGLEPKQLLPEVPYSNYIEALLYDQSRLIADLKDDTRNVLLTYARTWSTLKTNAFRSKPSAADWAIHHLPKAHQPVMNRAKLICIGVENEHWDDIQLLVKPCADFMVDQIHQASALVNLNDPNNFISLAE